MESQRCPECGLLNWCDQEACKRCGTPTRKLNGAPNVRSNRPTVPVPPTIRVLNGIGTRLLGWRHHEDGTATATQWFTILYLPVFPIKRFVLLSPTQAELFPKKQLPWAVMIFTPVKMALFASYTFLEQTPLAGQEVLRTYLYAYLWLPLQLYLPWVIINYVAKSSMTGPDDGSQTGPLVYGTLAMIWLGYVLFTMARLLHRTRGG